MSNEKSAKRGPDGKFLPGHQPPRSPGRPPGPNGVKARAAQIATDHLERMLGKAAGVIDAALDDGDSHVATWLIDRVRPPKQADYLKAGIDSDLKTPQEAVEAARQVVIAAGAGEVSMSGARAYIDIIARLGGMQGYLKLEGLRETLEELKGKQNLAKGGFNQSRRPPCSVIEWGKGAPEVNE